MDNNLNRSVRMLEESLVTYGKGSLVGGIPRGREIIKGSKHAELSGGVKYEYSNVSNTDNISIHERTFEGVLESNRSITGSVIRTKEPWKATVNSLYTEFYETLQTHSSGHEIFDVIADLARCCSDALQVIRSMKSKTSIIHTDEEIWLENERNTWRLLYVLYRDRLTAQSMCIDGEENNINSYFFGPSEKLCILNLFKQNSIVRESQLIVDWLEYGASERDLEALHFADNSSGWENTLHQLESAKTIVFESSRKIVSFLDPDAPYYEKLPLHDLDMEDEVRLCTRMFMEIRCGKLEQAKNLCLNSGHAWRAAMLEGWRLVHNPNLQYSKELELDSMDVDNAGSRINNESNLQIIEGNPARDIWKSMAFAYCKKPTLNAFEKAAIAAYCGNLQAIIPVCTSWEDLLWAYMRVLIDIRVESEVRDTIIKKFKPLPNEYWDQKMSLNDVFKYLESSENSIIRKESLIKDHIIQKFIILDEIPQLLDHLNRWIIEPTPDTQFLRFAAHLVLFLEQIGQIDQREISEKVVESYVSRLTEMNETRLVAFYVSKLGLQKQIQIYASYLERILDNDERREALDLGEDSGLNTQEITKRIVENIRNRPHEVRESGDLQKKITEGDILKISSIDWLLIYETQMLEAIKQTNALIFVFLTIQKLDAAQLAYNKIPSHYLERVIPEREISPDVDQIIKDYLSYKAYLDAHDAFNEWFKQYNSKPLPPEALPQNAQFTEKVAHQHRVSQFKAETERWKLSTSHLARATKTKLYNVLLFPEGGWLSGATDAEFLRSTCIPEIALLLYTILYKSNDHEECVQLADLLAAEKYGLYKVFSKEKLGVVLAKLCESSVALLHEKKDAWGNTLVE